MKSPTPSGGRQNEVQESIDAYLRELEVLGRSPHTVRAYRHNLDRLARHLHLRGIHRLERVDLPNILDHLRDLEREDGLSNQSMAQTQSAIRSWLTWLQRSGLFIQPPDLQARPHNARRLPRALTLEEVAALLNAPPRDAWTGLRDRAIIETLYSTGCRLAELHGMRWADLELGRGIVKVLGKGKKERLVPLGKHAVEAIKTYRDEPGPRVALPHRHWVWRSIDGDRLTMRQIQRRVLRWGRAAQIEFEVTPHVLRHTFATHLLAAGAPLLAVKELLGHASVATTQIYTHLVVDDLLAAFDRHHPRAM